MKHRRLVSGVTATGVAVLVLLATALQASGAVVTTRPPVDTTISDGITETAVTQQGVGRFTGLSVTVGKTQNLTDETIYVSWTGGAPSLYAGTTPKANFLQMMQCWGDVDATGRPLPPRRDQCGFGGDPLAGTPRTRTVLYGPADPDEAPPPSTGGTPAAASGAYDLPVTSALTGDTTTGFSLPFNAGNTNELPYLQTSADGTGETYFTVQALDAPWMGCANTLAVAGEDVSRPCYLVVVPRDTCDITCDNRPTTGLGSSPLQAANWAQRLEFPLSFVRAGGICTQATTQLTVYGSQLPNRAVRSWQNALCRESGIEIEYADIPEFNAEQAVASGRPAMVLTTSPANYAASAGPGSSVVFAPVGIAATGVGFLAERKFAGYPPETISADLGLDVATIRGTRNPALALTPRVIAKLISQSYVQGVFRNPAPPDTVKGNLNNVREDTEFTGLNPEFAWYDVGSEQEQVPAEIWLSKGPEAGISGFLRYVAEDPSAKAFIDGTPYQQGGKDVMRVNPTFKGTDLTQYTFFPQLDLSERAVPGIDKIPPEQRIRQDATLLHPIAGSFQTAALWASRGRTEARQVQVTVEPGLAPAITTVRLPTVPTGERKYMVFTDTASAAQYKLGMAALQSSSGSFIAPTTQAMLAAVDSMSDVAAVPGVRDATTAGKDQYCCVLPIYAVVDPAALTPDQRVAAARFLEYAVGPGQVTGFVPGQLPEGYAPLPDTMVAQSRDAAARVRGYQPPAPVTTPASTTAPTVPSSTTSASPAGSAVPGGGGQSPSQVPPAARRPTAGVSPVAEAGAPVPTASPGPSPSTLDVQQAGARAVTPAVTASLRWVVPTVALAGLAALIAGPLVLTVGRRRSSHGP